MIGALSVMVMNYLIPIITKESYTPAFILIAVFAICTILSLVLLIKQIKNVETN
jgi:ACS family hexuronate transporter-like MFS transporter